MSVVCPECDNPLDIDVDDVEEGEIIQCDECGTDLEVVSSDPLELAPVDEEGYDDEDDALPWMKRMNSSTPRRNLFLSLLAIAACLFVFAAPLARLAQKNAPRERIVEGKVVNKDGGPIGGAVVYLKNSRSNGVKTYIADDDGHFRFGELSQDTDYELWAESNTVRSKSRQISSFDNDNKFYFVLKVSVTKPVSLDSPAVSATGLPPQP